MAVPSLSDDVPGRLITRLRRQAEDIKRLTEAVFEENLGKRIAPDKWSLIELVCHIWRVQEVFEARVESMLTQNNPTIARYEPEGDPEFQEKLAEPAGDSLETFLAEREQFVTLLDSLSAADWRRPGTHPEFPHYDIRFQVEYMAHHEAHHIYQMFQRRTQLGRMPD